MRKDGMINISDMSLGWRHIRILATASLGQITGTALATLIGIVIPMIQLVIHPGLNSFEQGALACINLIGIMVSSPIVGKLSDRYGYLFFFRLCPIIVFVGSLIGFYSLNNIPLLALALFIMGVGVGGDYCLDSDYISELMPKKWKLFMVGTAKATSALGNILICYVCFFLLKIWNNPHMWNYLMFTISLMALIMIVVRLPFRESPKWFLIQGDQKRAEEAVHYFLGDNVQLDDEHINNKIKAKRISWKFMFDGKNLKRVIFSGVPWACEGFGVYGIGVFMPILLISLGLHPEHADKYNQIIWSVETSSYVSIFVLIGFAIGLAIVRRFNHVIIQTAGFVLCSVGILIMLYGYLNHLSAWVAIAGFMIFELFINAGPHLLTFIIPPQIYDVRDRSTGTGIADSFGKLGAVIGVATVPLLLHFGGVVTVLVTAVLVNLAGAVITGYYGRQILPRNSKE